MMSFLGKIAPEKIKDSNESVEVKAAEGVEVKKDNEKTKISIKKPTTSTYGSCDLGCDSPKESPRSPRVKGW